jgi:hypothetical protein
MRAGMSRFPSVCLLPCLASAVLWGCGPSAESNARAPAPAVNQVAAPPPAQPMKMVCRNSQSGKKAVCGTPNAVMVGMEPATNAAEPAR